MKLHPLNYKIAVAECIGIEIRTVYGFAVDTMPRICVQKDDYGWKATDYDTGYCISGWYDDRDECIKDAISLVSQKPLQYSIGREIALARLAQEGVL